MFVLYLNMKEISISSSSKSELIDITKLIKDYVKEIGVISGICLVYCPHTTAGITINENADPDVKNDIINKLKKMIPEKDDYKHVEGNSDSHLKSSLLGNSQSIIIKDNDLLLGTWQGIYFFEGDGPRERNVFVKIMGD